MSSGHKTRDRPNSIVKDLARVNLSLLNSNNTSQYHMFSNQSSDSINTINSVQNDNYNDTFMSYELQKNDSEVTRDTMTKSDSAFTWQSYSCSSRNSTLSSHFRDSTDPGDTATDPGANTEVENVMKIYILYFLMLLGLLPVSSWEINLWNVDIKQIYFEKEAEKL